MWASNNAGPLKWEKLVLSWLHSPDCLEWKYSQIKKENLNLSIVIILLNFKSDVLEYITITQINNFC